MSDRDWWVCCWCHCPETQQSQWKSGEHELAHGLTGLQTAWRYLHQVRCRYCRSSCPRTTHCPLPSHCSVSCHPISVQPQFWDPEGLLNCWKIVHDCGSLQSLHCGSGVSFSTLSPGLLGIWSHREERWPEFLVCIAIVSNCLWTPGIHVWSHH